MFSNDRKSLLVFLAALFIMYSLLALIIPKIFPEAVATPTLPEDGQELSFVIGGQSVCTTVAASGRSLSIGMTNRKKAVDRQGLYYSYPAGSKPEFWGKDMKFASEVWWMKNNKVIAVAPIPAKEGKEFPRVEAPTLVDGVIEMPLGTAKTLKVKDGATFEISKGCDQVRPTTPGEDNAS